MTASCLTRCEVESHCSAWSFEYLQREMERWRSSPLPLYTWGPHSGPGGALGDCHGKACSCPPLKEARGLQRSVARAAPFSLEGKLVATPIPVRSLLCLSPRLWEFLPVPLSADYQAAGVLLAALLSPVSPPQRERESARQTARGGAEAMKDYPAE